VNEFWFTPKLKGYGAVPSTWEGHTLVGVFASVVFICVLLMMRREKSSSIFPPPMIVVAVSTIIFLCICAWKTDGAWG
jgi:hypothetical protein